MTTATLHDRRPTTPAVDALRFDMYAPIHKALRNFMTDTLVRMGRLEIDDADEMTVTLAQLDALLDLCARHIEHEDRFLHPAIEDGGAPCRTALDHVEHGHGLAALGAEARRLRQAPSAALALQLYRHFALFVADNLQHMQIEETVNNAALWARHDDAALHALHERLLATLSDAERMQVARWMLPALPPAERAQMLGAMQAQMPPEAFRGVVDALRPHLGHAGWIKLARALKLAPVPGLVAVA